MTNRYNMPAEKVAVLLLTKPARTTRGREVQAKALFRVECGMWIEKALVSDDNSQPLTISRF
jgi:hypothetical protein